MHHVRSTHTEYTQRARGGVLPATGTSRSAPTQGTLCQLPSALAPAISIRTLHACRTPLHTRIHHTRQHSTVLCTSTASQVGSRFQIELRLCVIQISHVAFANTSHAQNRPAMRFLLCQFPLSDTPRSKARRRHGKPDGKKDASCGGSTPRTHTDRPMVARVVVVAVATQPESSS